MVRIGAVPCVRRRTNWGRDGVLLLTVELTATSVVVVIIVVGMGSGGIGELGGFIEEGEVRGDGTDVRGVETAMGRSGGRRP